MSERKDPRVIKRYANRKLYDMTESCYITHDEIAALVREGEEIRIIDNRTQEDLTSATLTQILLDEEKRVKRPLPIDTLRNFFQTGGDFIQRHIKQPVATLREEAERNVRRVFGKRDEKLGDAPEAIAPTPPPSPAPAAATATQTTRKVTADTLRDTLEERWTEIQHAISQFDYPKRIAELEHRVETLERELAALRTHEPDGSDEALD
jgi:polyhydroxyalkanoate synthesis repressor PhaR